MGSSQLHDSPILLDQKMTVAGADIKGIPVSLQPFAESPDQFRRFFCADLIRAVVQYVPVFIVLLFFRQCNKIAAEGYV